jgi:peptide/nickel transport system ATP-binding protein|tara:strand:- start:220 stop:1167 length:948 start_codon:yes stop_codon:yes gene_type:complete
MTLLSVTDLKIDAGDLSLVDGIRLNVNPAEVVALVGESGSGKSLTALSIMGLLGDGLALKSGSIKFDGVDLTQLSLADLRAYRGDDLAMIFQEPVSSLNPLLPVGEQVAESLITHGHASPSKAFLEAIEMLRRVGIPQPEYRATQLPTELSGGMCQRVMIAAALISKPRLLIADEPTTALDVTIQAQILELMGDLASDFGTAVLLITHDMGVVAELADRVYVMYGGRLVEEGPVEEIFATPRHPYTRMLLQTIPRMDEPPKAELFAIKGNVPSPNDWPEGCRFRTRCDRATAACSCTPKIDEKKHSVACFNPEEY